MSNLLPKKIKSKRVLQRHIRVASTAVFLFIIGVFIISAALLPVYFYAKVILMGVHDDQILSNISDTSEKSPSIGKQRQSLIRTLREDKALIDQLSKFISLPKAPETIEHVASLIMDIAGVELESFSYNSDIEKGVVRCVFSGKAISRSAVVDIKNVFEQSKMFDVIDFPIGNFTPQDGEYIFNMHIESVISKKKHE